MFIDYVTLLLVNMAAGFLILAAFLVWGLGKEDRRAWAPAFGAAGLVAFVNGLHMTWSWPLPGSFNIAFGEMSVLLGVILLAICWATARGRGLHAIGIYSFVAGAAAIVCGVAIAKLGLTNAPLLNGWGFVLSGIAGVLLGPAVCLRRFVPLRILAALVLVAAAVIWARTGGHAYAAHLDRFQQWKPAAMPQAPDQ